MATTTAKTKKISRIKETEEDSALTESKPTTTTQVSHSMPHLELFTSLSEKITKVKIEFENLQKEIEEERKAWKKEQADH